MQAFSTPRWEDYEYNHINANPFGWLGNGWTQNELDNTINVDYLNDENIDFPIPEKVSLEENGHLVQREGKLINETLGVPFAARL